MTKHQTTEASNGWTVHDRSGWRNRRMVGGEFEQEGPTSVGEMKVLLEDIRSKVTVVAEGHSGLVRQIGENREAIEGLERRVDKFEELVIKGFKELWEAVGKTNKSIDALSGKIDEGFEKLGRQLEEHVHLN